MNRFNIQYHASLDEQRDFIKEIIKEYGVYCCALRVFPISQFASSPTSIDNVDEIVTDSSIYSTFVFNIELQPYIENQNFTDKYPNCLILNIGRVRDGWLEESSIGTLSNNQDALKIWHSVGRRLKKIATTGGRFINTDYGVNTDAGNHRFTDGARRLYFAGIKIMPFGNPGPRQYIFEKN